MSIKSSQTYFENQFQPYPRIWGFFFLLRDNNSSSQGSVGDQIASLDNGLAV